MIPLSGSISRGGLYFGGKTKPPGGVMFGGSFLWNCGLVHYWGGGQFDRIVLLPNVTNDIMFSFHFCFLSKFYSPFSFYSHHLNRFPAVFKLQRQFSICMNTSNTSTFHAQLNKPFIACTVLHLRRIWDEFLKTFHTEITYSIGK